MSDNPFSAPGTDQAAAAATGIGGEYWAEGDILVVQRTGAALPDRCVKCNSNTSNRHVQTLYYVNPLLAILVAFSPIIYLIVYFIVRKKIVLNVGFCDEHRRQRVNAMIIGFGGCVVALLLGIGGMLIESLVLGALGLLAFFGLLIYGVIRSVVLRPTGANDEHGMLKGAHADFLAQLDRDELAGA